MIDIYSYYAPELMALLFAGLMLFGFLIGFVVYGSKKELYQKAQATNLALEDRIQELLDEEKQLRHRLKSLK